MKITVRPSPNRNERPAGTIIDTIVLHATGGASAEGDVNWCLKSKEQLRALWAATPVARRPKVPWGPVSYHYIVSPSGFVTQMVETQKRAWHAGTSSFLGRPNVNDFSIGIAFSNRNDGREAYTPEALESAAALCAELMEKYRAIHIERITTHYAIAPGRKSDPREPFDLTSFRSMVAERRVCRLDD